MTAMHPNVRAPYLLVVRTNTPCPECDKPTPVFAIAFPTVHEERDAEEGSGDAWQRCRGTLLVQTFLDLKGPACKALEELAPSLYADTWDGPWHNHCAHCHHALEDEDLHTEPGDAFLPTTRRQAKAIRVIKIDHECNAVVDSVSYDPPGLGRLRHL